MPMPTRSTIHGVRLYRTERVPDVYYELRSVASEQSLARDRRWWRLGAVRCYMWKDRNAVPIIPTLWLLLLPMYYDMTFTSIKKEHRWKVLQSFKSLMFHNNRENASPRRLRRDTVDMVVVTRNSLILHRRDCSTWVWTSSFTPWLFWKTHNQSYVCTCWGIRVTYWNQLP